MSLTRRRFLQGAGAALSVLALPGLPRPARGALGDPVLAVIYLRGAADGLNLVAPLGDPDYALLRPDLRVTPEAAVPLDGFFGLNPALASLEPLYADGDLAIVHAAGSPHGSRSHFDAQDFMERAAPGDRDVTDGWLNRYLATLVAPDAWTGVSIGPASAAALAGARPSLALGSLEAFALQATGARRAALASLYEAGDPHPELAGAAGEAFEALDVIGAVPTDTGTVYPPGPVGSALRDAAALVRADVGVRVVAVDSGGWDHHEGEADALPPVALDLAGSIAAFREDLGSHWERTCVLVMTEFGRTAAQNGSLGTDHGHGSVMLAAGAGVAGGRVVLQGGGWPGLGPADLFEGRDLVVTTDFRDVFAEVLHRHLGVPLGAVAPVLPDHPVETARFPGLFA